MSVAQVRRRVGETASPIRLSCVDGSTFDTGSLLGRRFMLSFFRFASCPFCNLRVSELVRRFGDLGEAFTIIAVFDSPLDNLRRHAEGRQAPFPMLADETGASYRDYGIEHSVGGVLKGMLFRMPTLLRAMSQGYVPTTLKGSLTTMPADFLVDERGVIQVAHYGGDEGDHLPFEDVQAFALGRTRPTEEVSR
jgi:peroxiredoxin